MTVTTRQFEWIALLHANLRTHFAQRAGEVYVAAQQRWYPVEGKPEIGHAPSVFVVLGRPQGHRETYQQWTEGNVPVTVAFEIRSVELMRDYDDLVDVLHFYQDHEVEEYLLFDPDTGAFYPHLKSGSTNRLRPLARLTGVYTSSRLGITFDTRGSELQVSTLDGRPFLSHQQLEQQRALAGELAALERQRADRLLAIAERLAHGLATTEDVAELQRLRDHSA